MSKIHTKSVVSRFFKKVNKTDSCWMWTASKTRDGYGRMRVGGRLALAHRLSYEISRGHLPSYTGRSGCLLHKCGITSCVNPDHLYVGTQKQNASDRRKHGTQHHPSGETNSNARLCEEQVKSIRCELSNSKVAEIARKYGVGWTCISDIKNNRSWTHI